MSPITKYGSVFWRPISLSKANMSKSKELIVSKTDYFCAITFLIVSYECSFLEEEGLRTENAFDAVS